MQVLFLGDDASLFVWHNNAAGRAIVSSQESRKQFNCYDFSFYYLWILAREGEKEKSSLVQGRGQAGARRGRGAVGGVVSSEDRRLWVLRKR